MTRTKIVESTPSAQNPVAAHCSGKVAFDSPRRAEKVAKRQRVDGSVRYAYHCHTCRKWHLASRDRRMHLVPTHVKDRRR